MKWIDCNLETPAIGVEAVVSWAGTEDKEFDYLEYDSDTGNEYWANNWETPPTHWLYMPDVPDVLND